MATTYTLIASNTLSASAASVTFSSIPNTYTDLVLRTVCRWDSSGNPYLMIRFNGDSSALYSSTILYNASGAGSNRQNSQTQGVGGVLASSTAFSNVFATGELYIPGYQLSQIKPFGTMASAESTSASADFFVMSSAATWAQTATITSLTALVTSGNLIAGSAFYLYGIKKS